MSNFHGKTGVLTITDFVKYFYRRKRIKYGIRKLFLSFSSGLNCLYINLDNFSMTIDKFHLVGSLLLIRLETLNVKVSLSLEEALRRK